MKSAINMGSPSDNLQKKPKPNVSIAVIFVLHALINVELPVPAPSVGIVHQMAGNKFQ